MKFGEHRGGMYVRAHGLRDGRPVERSWHLIAEGDDGPYIPSMAVEALVRKLLAGTRPEAGARPATRALALSDYGRLFAGRAIHTGFRDPEDHLAPLYRRVLGSAFAALPPPLQALHGSPESRRWSGHAEVRRGGGLVARLVCSLIGFPRASAEVSVTVTLDPEGQNERWTRDFAGRRFSSRQSTGTGRNDRLLVERFGWVDVALALVVEEGRLFLVPRRWSCLGVPLPRVLLPSGRSVECERDGQFAFDVEIAAPLAGLIVAYRGTLQPAG